MNDNKKNLRRRIIKWRDDLDPMMRNRLSVAAAQHLLAWPLYRQAGTVLLFAGVRSEIETEFLTRRSLDLGKRVAMPRCVPATRELLILKIKDWSDLKPSYFGLLEPSGSAPVVPLSKLDLIVVPGVAFSTGGYRVGYGAGWLTACWPSSKYSFGRIGI